MAAQHKVTDHGRAQGLAQGREREAVPCRPDSEMALLPAGFLLLVLRRSEFS